MDTRHVHVQHDAEAGVWWAESDDLPGLVSEVPTLDGLVDRLATMAGDLLRAHGVTSGTVALMFVAVQRLAP